MASAKRSSPHTPEDASQASLLRLRVESLIFCAPQPISTEDLCKHLQALTPEETTKEAVEQSIQQLVTHYETGPYAFHIRQVGGGYCFLLKEAHHEAIRTLMSAQNKHRLSAAGLETLAIIAYEQPISKSAIERARGVNSDGIIYKLLEKNLIAVRKQTYAAGKPLLYETTPQFMNYLGINHMEELPPLKELQKALPSFGEDEEDG